MGEIRADVIRYLRQIAEEEPEIILDRPLPEKNVKASPKTRISERQPVQTRKAPQAPPTSIVNVTVLNDIKSLEEVGRIAAGCTNCSLHQSRKNVVFGVGNPNADLMFIGEAPGADEDRQGEPFVGRAGQLLNKIITAMEMRREDVYIANILKCRPPGNRDPLQEEADCCTPYLHKQIEFIAPKLIVALGLVAAKQLLKAAPNTTLKSLRSQIFSYQGRPLMVTYHPAALLRNQNLKRPAWEDMQTAMKLLSGELKWEPTDSQND